MSASIEMSVADENLAADDYTGLQALSFSGASAEIFAAIDACAYPVLRHSQCTINRFDAAKMELTRIYSSNIKKYPVGGIKSKSDKGWGRQVLLEKRLFVGEGVAAIKKSFDDYELIIGLGLRSVINIPLVSQNSCLGTLNFLSKDECVTHKQIVFAQSLGLLAIPGVLATLPLPPQY
ncbi:MAG: GAF domain-containing protein [Paralcaligenes sp.]